MKKKIILLVNNLSDTGGVSTRCKSMYRYLSKYYICEIIELRALLGYIKMHEINLISLARLVFALNKRLKRDVTSIVVISFSDLPNLVNSLSNSNSIISITGFPLKRKGLGYFRYILWKYCLNVLTLICCNRIVPCSPIVVPKFIRKLPIIENKVFIINGFLDKSRLISDIHLSNSLKSEFPEGYFLYIGLLDKNKCVDCIIESYRIYCENTHKKKKLLPLLIVGSGPHENIYKKIAANLNLSTASFGQSSPLIFHRKATKSAYTYIENATLVLLGSKSEGFSNVALECLYSKTPILLSNNKGNKFLYDFISSGRNLFSMQLLPFPSTDKSLLEWASCMYFYAHIFSSQRYDFRKQVIEKCSAEVNNLKWIKIINSI